MTHGPKNVLCQGGEGSKEACTGYPGLSAQEASVLPLTTPFKEVITTSQELYLK